MNYLAWGLVLLSLLCVIGNAAAAWTDWSRRRRDVDGHVSTVPSVSVTLATLGMIASDHSLPYALPPVPWVTIACVFVMDASTWITAAGIGRAVWRRGPRDEGR